MKTKEWYLTRIYMYGVISTLLALKFFEEQEMYEHCSVIKQAILAAGFESKITDELIDDVVSHHSGIWSKEQVIEANRYYSEVLINEALESYTVLEIPPSNI